MARLWRPAAGGGRAGAGAALPHRRGAVHHRRGNLARTGPCGEGRGALHALDDNVLRRLRSEQRPQRFARAGAQDKQIPARATSRIPRALSFQQPSQGSPLHRVLLRRPAHGAGRLAGLWHQVCAIHTDFAYLMYPAAGSRERLYHRPFTADMRVTVPAVTPCWAAGRLAPGGREKNVFDSVRASVVSRQPRVVKGDP